MNRNNLFWKISENLTRHGQRMSPLFSNSNCISLRTKPVFTRHLIKIFRNFLKNNFTRFCNCHCTFLFIGMVSLSFKSFFLGKVKSRFQIFQEFFQKKMFFYFNFIIDPFRLYLNTFWPKC